MKTWILGAMMMAGVIATAQEKKERPEHLKPEQRVELHVKQMDLALDLTDKQQKDIEKLFLERAKKSEQLKATHKANKDAGKKLTADEKFAMKSKRLDEQIAMKTEMKKILNAEQFTKWENMKKKRHGKMAHNTKKFAKKSEK